MTQREKQIYELFNDKEKHEMLKMIIDLEKIKDSIKKYSEKGEEEKMYITIFNISEIYNRKIQDRFYISLPTAQMIVHHFAGLETH